jgi:hypothetical protein
MLINECASLMSILVEAAGIELGGLGANGEKLRFERISGRSGACRIKLVGDARTCHGKMNARHREKKTAALSGRRLVEAAGRPCSASFEAGRTMPSSCYQDAERVIRLRGS